MKLCIPTMWDDEYLYYLASISDDIDFVHEVFGSIPISVIGSARSENILPYTDMEKTKKHIKKVHSLGMKFNYLLNSSCIGNLESSKEKKQKLREYIENVRDCKADIVTVTSPFIIELIKSVYPEIKVNVSTIAEIDNPRKAKLAEDMGADRITLSLMVNRDLDTIKKIRDLIDCGMEILVSEGCLYFCPYRTYHYNLLSHGSQCHDNNPTVEYPALVCTMKRLQDISEIIKSPFIRPEDVEIYEKIGVEFIKIGGRGKDTEVLKKRAKHYLSRTSPENLNDILSIRMYSVLGFEKPKVYIDSKKLNGFVEKVSKNDCRNSCGTACNYCSLVAKKAVRIDIPNGYMKKLGNMIRDSYE